MGGRNSSQIEEKTQSIRYLSRWEKSLLIFSQCDASTFPVRARTVFAVGNREFPPIPGRRHRRLAGEDEEEERAASKKRV